MNNTESLKVDLHVHSTYSDGTLTPEKIIEEAKKQNVRIISLTDHDNYKGIEEAVKFGKQQNITVIPGIEISANMGLKEFHILGYYIDHTNRRWEQFLQEAEMHRISQIKAMCKKLFEMGYNINYDEVMNFSGSRMAGTYLIGLSLMKKGCVKNLEEANKRFVGKRGSAFIPRESIQPLDAIKLITECGGVPVLAHPFISKNVSFIHELKDGGLKGIEVYYPRHAKDEIEELERVSSALNLIKTGGTDYHGPLGPHCDDGFNIGDMKVPLLELERLKDGK